MFMKKIKSKGEYLAPDVKVMEMKSRAVLCASGNNESYDNGNWQWS